MRLIEPLWGGISDAPAEKDITSLVFEVWTRPRTDIRCEDCGRHLLLQPASSGSAPAGLAQPTSQIGRGDRRAHV